MSLTITQQGYKQLEQLFSEVYNRAASSQEAVRILSASYDGTVSVNGVQLTPAQIDAREQKLKDDWAAAKASLIPQIDAVLGA